MLQKANSEIAYCYQRAEECKRMAGRVDPKDMQEHLDMMDRWLRLAFSYEFSDRFTHLATDMTCTLDQVRIGRDTR